MHQEVCEREGWCWFYNLIVWGWLPILILSIQIYGWVRRKYIQRKFDAMSQQDKAFYLLNEHIENITPVGETKVGGQYYTVVNLEKHGGESDKP